MRAALATLQALEEVRVFVYPPPDSAWRTLAIEAGYGRHLRLTWPARAAELEVRGGGEIAGELVRGLGDDGSIVARVGGVASHDVRAALAPSDARAE